MKLTTMAAQLVYKSALLLMHLEPPLLQIAMNALHLVVLFLTLGSPLCHAMDPLITLPQSANWFGYGWLWLDFGMLGRESVCSALVHNQTDIVLFGLTASNQLAVMGKNQYGYLVDRGLLTGDSSATYTLSLSDRYEIEPEHLFLEYRNISWFKVDDEIVSMYLYDEGPNQGSSMAVQTTTRRIRLVHQSFTVISENWTPPDGLLFLSTHKRSNSTGKPLAIYNLPDRFCVIFHKWQLDKIPDVYYGNAQGPEADVEEWPWYWCIATRSPVACGGSLEGDTRLVLTFRNRSVSIVNYQKPIRVMAHFTHFKDFLSCTDENRIVLLVLAILLLTVGGALLLIFLTKIVLYFVKKQPAKAKELAKQRKISKPKIRSPGTSSPTTGSQSRTGMTTATADRTKRDIKV